MSTPIITTIYDRRKRSSANKEGSVEIRITYERKQHFITTGIRCLPRHWRNGCFTNRVDAFELQNTLDSLVTKTRKIVNEMIEKGELDLDNIASVVTGKVKAEAKVNVPSNVFVADYMRERAEVRKYGRKADTQARYDRFIKWFEEWGVIRTFDEVTEQTILLMDEALTNKLCDRKMKDKSKWHNYHRFFKSFLIDAKDDGLIQRNPYKRLNIGHGDDNDGLSKYLTKDEFNRLCALELPVEYLVHARDLFVFQTYTCMSYVDMAAFALERTVKVSGKVMYYGRRGKTGKEFSFVILEPAMRVLDKYGGRLPMMSMQKYNLYLKDVAVISGLNKALSSHWARHTGATLLLNAGVDMEIVSRILGHSSTKMTREVYAKMLDTTIADAMSKVTF